MLEKIEKSISWMNNDRRVETSVSSQAVTIDRDLDESRFYMSVYIHLFFACLLYVVALSRLLNFEQLTTAPAIAAAFIVSSLLYKAIAPTAVSFRARPLIEIAGVCAFALIIFRYFQDPSYDGPHYHLPATIALSNGWNPQYQSIGEFIDRYPNGIWTLRAIVFAMTSHIGDGRLINVVLALTSYYTLIYAISVTAEHAISPARRLVALLAAFNPIVTAQLVTNYVDGAVASTSLSLICCLALRRRKESRTIAIVASSVVCTLLINAKTTGLYYAFVLIAATFVFEWMRVGLAVAWIQANFRAVVAFVIVGLLSITLVGYRPYVTNLVNHGTIFYPSSEVILADFRPSNLNNASQITKFAHAIFSSTGGHIPREESVLKIPGTVSWTEIAASTGGSDSGGFGPLFSLLFVMAVLIVLRSAWVDMSSVNTDVFLMAVVAFLSAAAFPEPWLARFVPLLGVSIFLLLLSVRSWEKSKLLVGLFITLAFINLSFFVMKVGWSAFIVTRNIAHDTGTIAKAAAGRVVAVSDAPDSVDLGLYVLQLLKERGIAARIEACQNEEYINFFYDNPKLCWLDVKRQ